MSVAPDTLTTSAHFLISSAMKALNFISSWSTSGWLPISSKGATTALSVKALCIASESFFTTGCGVPAGTTMPDQLLDSSPGNPASPIVGTAGKIEVDRRRIMRRINKLERDLVELADTRALQNREKVQRDSINYFPPNASQGCALVFFPDLTSRASPRDEIELSDQHARLLAEHGLHGPAARHHVGRDRCPARREVERRGVRVERVLDEDRMLRQH